MASRLGAAVLSPAEFELHPENRLPMFMTFVACALYISWVIVNVPNAFTAGVSYLALLTIAAIAYLASSLANVGRSMDFGDPERAYHAIGTGLLIGFAVALPILIKVVVPTFGAVAAVPTAITALFVCFIAPIVEELFFAGVLLPVFTAVGGALVGIAMTSVLFAVFHYAVYGVALATMLYLALFRAVVSAVQLRYGGIAPGIYAHMVVNLVSYLVSITPKTVEVKQMPAAAQLMTPGAGAVVVLGVLRRS